MRDTFRLYLEDLEILDDLTLEQGGCLFLNIRNYQLGKKLNLNLEEKIIFEPFLKKFKEDELKSDYENIDTFLYIVELFDCFESFIKIGISSNPDRRFSDFKRTGYRVLNYKVHTFGSRSEAREEEILLHNQFSKFKYYPTKRFAGYTECFSKNITEDHIFKTQIV